MNSRLQSSRQCDFNRSRVEWYMGNLEFWSNERFEVESLRAEYELGLLTDKEMFGGNNEI